MAAAEPRVITLVIDKVVPGVYRAEALVRGGPVSDANEYSSISDAIREEAAAVPDGFAQFMEVRYCGLSSGTLRLEDGAKQGEEIATRLTSLLAEMHSIAQG